MPVYDQRITDRFWKKVDQSAGPDGCWPWLGAWDKGYGKFGIGAKVYRAHRCAYEIARGPIPTGMLIRHLCHYRPCCNPHHLEVGTELDNAADYRAVGGYAWRSIGYRQPVPAKPTPTARDRFWTHVAKSSGCWNWRSSLTSSGYGQFQWRGRCRAAHRVSWEFFRGPIPEGLWVLHKCDNRLCVNPDHLYLGTVIENNADIMARGRHRSNPKKQSASMKRWCAEHPEQVRAKVDHMLSKSPPRRGSKHPMAKLTEDQVRDIYRQCLQGFCLSRIARTYGVTTSLICAISKRRIWRHVTDLEA